MSTTTSTSTDSAQIIQPEVRTSIVDGTATEVSVQASSHAFTIDEPPALGGTDKGANPVEHLLAALGSCQAITFQVWAEKLGIVVDHVDVGLTGTLDLRGFFGLDPEVRPGFQSIDISITLSGPEPEEKYRQLNDAVQKHCPVLDTLGALGVATPVHTTYTIG